MHLISYSQQNKKNRLIFRRIICKTKTLNPVILGILNTLKHRQVINQQILKMKINPKREASGIKNQGSRGI